MRKFSADTIYPIDSSPITNGVIITDDEGKILSLDILENHDSNFIEKFEGIIIPGFVNTHCHLELSHMKGKVNTGTGLISFITDVVTTRAASEEEKQQAIIQAEEEMIQNGIVAVGDICNTTDTFSTKEKSSLYYSSFIEMFDFFQEKDAQNKFDQYKKVYDSLNTPTHHKKSMVPHASYSVSKKLFQLINEHNSEDAIISIHNQETPAENELFLYNSGAFIPWYASFNLILNDFKATGKTAIHYPLQELNPQLKTLFIHNTLSTKEDIIAAQKWNSNIYWTTCPNANLYIENKLPNYQNFIDTKAKVCIGTDSLTSNWNLCILSELKTISKYQSYISLETLLQWSTLNGAEALGFDSILGSISVGKKPGLNLLQNCNKTIQENTTITKLI